LVWDPQARWHCHILAQQGTCCVCIRRGVSHGAHKGIYYTLDYTILYCTILYLYISLYRHPYCAAHAVGVYHTAYLTKRGAHAPQERVAAGGVTEYLTQWVGQTAAEQTWEPGGGERASVCSRVRCSRGGSDFCYRGGVSVWPPLPVRCTLCAYAMACREGRGNTGSLPCKIHSVCARCSSHVLDP
jgi:hypothetical protein